MTFRSTLLAALAAGLALPAHAAEPRELGVEARIPFADTVGVRNFRADDEDSLWIEDNHRNWYRAELIGPCIGLDFATAIGVVTRGTGALDKFGAILVDGRKCQLTSLVTSGPPPDKKRKADDSGDEE